MGEAPKTDPEPDQKKDPSAWSQWRMRQDKRDLDRLKAGEHKPEDVQKLVKEQSARFASIMKALRPRTRRRCSRRAARKP